MVSRRNSKQAILATLIYSNIFNFPLTKEELWQFLISNTKITKQEFDTALSTMPQITYKDRFFCLKGKENSIRSRILQKNELSKKKAIAKRAAYYLSYIPTIKLIGISGSLAMGDAQKDDDIDFFIITQKGTLWMSRFWSLIILEALNLRRKRGDKKAPNKICCNLFIEEDRLAWPSKKQSIYTAHEIVQMKPLFERQAIYHQFLAANQWVETYFPNYIEQPHHIHIRQHKEYYTLKILQRIGSIKSVKKAVEFLQKKYMKQHQTNETIERDILAFHPHDYGANTMRLFNSGLKKYGL